MYVKSESLGEYTAGYSVSDLEPPCPILKPPGSETLLSFKSRTQFFLFYLQIKGTSLR